MACLPCVRNNRVAADDRPDPVTGLTKKEEKVVQESWAVINSDWKTKHGVTFFVRLFKAYPKIKAYFSVFNGMSSDEMVAATELCSHVVIFATAISAMMDNLANPEVLVDLIHKLTDAHFGRGVTADEFDQALGEFVDYVVDTVTIPKFTETAWRKTVSVVSSVVRNHISELKNDQS